MKKYLIPCLLINTAILGLSPEHKKKIETLLTHDSRSWNKKEVQNYLDLITQELPSASVKEKIVLTHYKERLLKGLQTAPQKNIVSKQKKPSKVAPKKPLPTFKKKSKAPQQSLPLFPQKKTLSQTAEQTHKDFLLAHAESIDEYADKQTVDQVVTILLQSNKQSSLAVQQEFVPQQVAADCGYHALKNAISFSIGKDLDLSSLLPQWKNLIKERRKTQPAGIQETDWLEWNEISYLFEHEKNSGILKNSNTTAIISEDPFNMWHEFMSLRAAASTCARNNSCTHLFIIGTGEQKEITSKNILDTVADFLKLNRPAIFGGHWYSLVVRQINHKRTYIVADSVNQYQNNSLEPDRRNDARTLRMITLFENLIDIYR